MKNKVFKLLLVFFLFVIFFYISAVDSIPDNIILFENEKLEIKDIYGISINNENILEASSSNQEKMSYTESVVGEYTINLFENIFLKNINVEVIPTTKVIPVGSIAGLKLYTSGVLVVGMTEIQGIDNIKYTPYENTEIKEGDTIIKVNNITINSTEDLKEVVNNSNGEILDIVFIQNEIEKVIQILPVKTGEKEYKLGLWVRDSAAGVGTITFYDPTSQTFGALGHGISDIDTDKLIDIASGEFVTAEVLNIDKGEEGEPGKIEGLLENNIIGNIYMNSEFGIYGTIENVNNLGILEYTEEIEVALKSEIREGEATILCDIDNEGVKEYEIQIEEIYINNNYDNKSMKISVTDEELLEKTGGIIQGMSGSPIIQNGKFIGAITHVLYSNPRQGYAVFGEIMVKEMSNN